MRVVEPPVGDRRAGDRRVEHVGTAHHRQRGEIAAEAPAADRDPVEVERVVLGRGMQRVDLIVEDRRRQIEMDRALPLAATPGRAASVDDDDGEALIGEPLRQSVRLRDASTYCTCGPP